MPSVKTPSAPTDHYTIISADCHAGGSHAMYREYLDPEYLEDFDAWRGKYKNPYRDLRDTDLRIRNWDDERRQSDQEADGVVGEVMFPNTVPPFFPSFVLFARPPTPDEYEHRLAGIRAHNRWLVDFCAAYPERRAGIGQIFLNDVDDAMDDVRWIKEHGLRGGILPAEHPARREVGGAALRPGLRPALGAVRGARRPGQRPRRHRLARLRHVTDRRAAPDQRDRLLLAAAVRAVHPVGRLRALPAAQVRHDRDGLRLDPTDARAARRHDREHPRLRLASASSSTRRSTCSRAPRPSTSTRTAGSARASRARPMPRSRKSMGSDRFMWGSDYPHDEGTGPFTREHLRQVFHDADPAELQHVLAGNAAKLYDFDLAALQPVADQFGPDGRRDRGAARGAPREREPRAHPGIQGVEVVTLEGP